MIPEDQLPNAQIFESINTNIYPPAVVEVAVESAVQNTTDTESTNAPNIENQEKAAELNAMRAQLRQAYIDIQAEKKALGDPPPKKVKSGVKSDYVQKSKALNQKIAAYNKLSREFDEKVKVFNNAKNKK